MPDGGQGRCPGGPHLVLTPQLSPLTLQVGTAGLRQAGWRVQSGEALEMVPWGLRAGLLIPASRAHLLCRAPRDDLMS